MRLCHKCSPVLRSSPLHRKYAAAFSFAALLQDDRQRKNLPESKVCEANAVIGECALRTGSYALAEEAFRNMMKFRKDAFPVNQLATALKNRVKIKRQRNFSGRWPTALRCRSGRRIGLKRSARCWLCPVLRRVLSVPGRSECWKHCWRMILTILNTVSIRTAFGRKSPPFPGEAHSRH